MEILIDWGITTIHMKFKVLRSVGILGRQIYIAIKTFWQTRHKFAILSLEIPPIHRVVPWPAVLTYLLFKTRNTSRHFNVKSQRLPSLPVERYERKLRLVEKSTSIPRSNRSQNGMNWLCRGRGRNTSPITITIDVAPGIGWVCA